MRDILADPRAGTAIKVILDPQDMIRVRKVINELEKAATKGSKVGGVMDDMPNRIISLIARTISARTGAQVGQGASGASLLTAHFFSRNMQDMLERLTNDKAAALLNDAIQDPELFRDLLLANPRVSRQAKRAEARLTEWLAGSGSVAVGAEEDPLGPEQRTAPAGPWMRFRGKQSSGGQSGPWEKFQRRSSGPVSRSSSM